MRSPVDLSRLDVFLAVAETRGFTTAAARLGATKAMVSQQISRLESEVGASLFNRTTRRVTLTDAGHRLYERALPLVRELTTVLDEVGGDDRSLTGTLRITSSDDYVAAELAEQLARFADLHPRLTIDLVTSDEVLDLVGEGLDVAIRTGWLRDSSMHAVRLRGFQQYVVASPELLAQSHACDEPADLEGLPWIALTRLRSPLSWNFVQGRSQRSVRVSSRVRTDSSAASLALARAGAGATVLADFMAAKALNDGSLVRLLPDWSLPEGGVYAVYPATRHAPSRVRALLDFIKH
jgi:DNA-binding transcriptional LysR family regulator